MSLPFNRDLPKLQNNMTNKPEVTKTDQNSNININPKNSNSNNIARGFSQHGKA